jgi:hypothetical protein
MTFFHCAGVEQYSQTHHNEEKTKHVCFCHFVVVFRSKIISRTCLTQIAFCNYRKKNLRILLLMAESVAETANNQLVRSFPNFCKTLIRAKA